MHNFTAVVNYNFIADRYQIFNNSDHGIKRGFFLLEHIIKATMIPLL